MNAEFAEGYVELYESEGYEAVVAVGPNPETEFNPEMIEPQIGADSEIGDFAFVGFQAEVINATVESGALISAGSYVEEVTIPEDALLAPGTVVTDQATADALPTVETAEEDFKRAVLEVNAEFAEGYVELYEKEGYDAVVGVGPNPQTEFNPESVEPQIGARGEVGEFARIVGDVRLGAGSEVADRAAIRADEGAPIVIGENAEIDERVTFHALEETSITVGDNLIADDDTVLHGPLEVGDNLAVGDARWSFGSRWATT